MSLRAERAVLLERTDLVGEAFCSAYTAAADRWLAGLFQQAARGDDRGIALLAVGGYGRSELCPASDLDVLLLHRGGRDVSAMAEQLWYPVWDDGISLDHSVRRPRQALEVAQDDLPVALGLLDARLVAGEARLAHAFLADARAQWSRQRPPRLEELAELQRARHAEHGDVAFLLEPDLKEGHGGLRDTSGLDALLLAVPRLADYVDTVAVASARSTLLAARVELHRRAGRELNTLVLQEQEAVAVRLGLADGDALMHRIAAAGRTIAWESDDAWRRLAAWSRHGGHRRGFGRRSIEPPDSEGAAVPVDGEAGVGLVDGEVTLLPDADLSDPSLALRLAAVAAERDEPVERSALNLLGRRSPAPPEPWPAAVRDQFVRVLSAGEPAVAVLEALDRRGILARYLPEWRDVRNKPQRNPYHRFTVDRHLLEATATAARLAGRVQRSDLLLVGTLLHDLGKGYPGDHTDVGVELARRVGSRMGFPPPDVEVLTDLVGLHLLLPEMATRRDLDDPTTAQRVAEEVGSRDTLELLAVLVEADGRATGPTAWGPWKAGLVAQLVERTDRALAGDAASPPAPRIVDVHREVMEAVRDTGRPVLQVADPWVTVVAPDRPGLLAEVTGVLALHGLNVRSADIDGADGVAVEVFAVEPQRGRWPTAPELSADLDAVMAGTLDLDARLDERARTYRGARRAVTPQLVTTTVTVDNQASATATVVEVRAEDLVGQLHRITRALVECRLDVISARASTFGPAVVDAFYVRDEHGGKLLDPQVVTHLEQAVRARVATEL
ncbi:MAG: [protein-PII] uridylyltransferase [Acidimicrobiales bacterium]